MSNNYKFLFPQKQNKQSLELKVDINKKEIQELDIEQALKNYLASKFVKGRVGSEGQSSKLANKLRLCEFEEASDNGHLRWLPKGAVVFDVVKKFCEYVALEELNSCKIDSPIMYDWSYPDIQEQGVSFHERHYKLELPDSDKKLVLRFAGDFGLFRIMKQSQLSYRNLPVRMFEFSKSFRYEKHGEISGLRRPRAFHMPDIHSFCRDLEGGWEEFAKLFKSYEKLNQSLGLNLAVEFPIAEDFWNQNKEKVQSLVDWLERPVLLEILPSRKHYWVIKGDFHYVDPSGSEGQISTVQLDIEDAKRYGIDYIDEKGSKNGCIIVHSSMGSIERIVYALLEESVKNKRLPFWLAPVQVRILPISDEFNMESFKLGQRIENDRYRVSVDDRSERLSYKVRDLGKNWIPYGIILGSKELESERFSIKSREDEDFQCSEKEFMSLLETKQNRMPKVGSYMSLEITKNPIF